MTERGLPIVDGAPACPFVAFEDDRDERATSPDHRHRCYAETQPAPRALAHQEAYCLSSAFPVCPTFQDWARREAARARADAARPAPTRDAPTDADAAAAAAAGAGLSASQRNPPRNWAAPPPWMSRRGGSQAASEQLWAEEDDYDDAEGDAPIVAQVPRRGRGLSGSYADRVASDADPDAAAGEGGVGAAGFIPDGLPDDGDEDAEDAMPRRVRHREREAAATAGVSAGAGAGGAGGTGSGRERQNRGPAPEWERAKPMEAYPTLRSRRLPELAIPPILVAVVAIALAAAVLFALPGLLGFGNPSAGGSQSPSTPTVTALPSLPPTPVPQATPVVYVVQAGDTLSRIAGRFGIALADLIAANTETLPDVDKLQIGDRLVIPVPQPSELPAASEIPGAS
jgi:hypothetical protein